jgi:putative peptidoglycan lipid II flippase
VASLAFPAITRALAGATGDDAPVRRAFALAWTLACAAAAGLLVAGPGLAQLLFGWGRMTPDALAQVARWGMAGAWGLLPQALTAVALTVLATPGADGAGRHRLRRGAADSCWPAPPAAGTTASG